MNDRLTPGRENEIREKYGEHHWRCSSRSGAGCDCYQRFDKYRDVRDLFAELDVCRRDLAEEQARTTRLTEFVRRARPLLGMSISNSLGAQADKLLAECGAGTEQPA